MAILSLLAVIVIHKFPLRNNSLTVRSPFGQILAFSENHPLYATSATAATNYWLWGLIDDLLFLLENRRWSFTSAISHQTWSIGWWRLCCDGERGSVPQLRRENSFLFVGPETYKLSGRGGSGRGDARAGPRKQKWRCCSRGEERSGRYWVSLSLQQDRWHLGTSWC